MKRLLCIINSMDAGGAETFLMKLYRNIDREKYQIDFCVCTEGHQFYEDEIKELGGTIYHIPPKSNGIKLFRASLFSVVKNNNYKYVLKVASNAISFYDLKIAKAAGAVYCSYRSSNSSDGGDLKSVMVNKICRVLFQKYVDTRIAPSDLAAEYTFGKKAYNRGEVFILHNALDLDVYSFNKDARKKIRDKYGISDDTLVIGHVGRFQPQKNHMFLLSVFSSYHERYPNSVLMLVGDGSLHDQLEKEAERLGILGHIIFTGIQKNIPGFLSSMDLFAFPSLYEGMPNSVIEAQAVGLPCLISDQITREADCSGNITYLPIDQGVDQWVDAIYKTKSDKRDTHDSLMKAGYDIKAAARAFVEIAYGRN